MLFCVCMSYYVFVFNISTTASHMERVQQLKLSSDRVLKPGIGPTSPGLEGKWFIHYTKSCSFKLFYVTWSKQRIVHMNLHPLCMGAAKALARLWICIVSSEPSLLADPIRATTLCPGSKRFPNLRHFM